MLLTAELCAINDTKLRNSDEYAKTGKSAGETYRKMAEDLIARLEAPGFLVYTEPIPEVSEW